MFMIEFWVTEISRYGRHFGFVVKTLLRHVDFDLIDD